MVRKKKERKPKKFSEAIGIQNTINNEKTDFLLGVVLLLIAIYFVISMVSYLSTGQADQSILEDMRPGEWMNSNHDFINYGGSLGAIIAYTLITINFGLPAFLIPAFIILVALKLMRAYNVNLWKWFLGTMLLMVWSSVTLAKFLTPLMGDQVFNPGGNHGLFCVQQMENLVGPPGLTAILFFVALAFLTYLSSETIEVVRKAMNPVKYLTSKVKFTITNSAEKKEEEVTEEPVAEPETRETTPAQVLDLTDFSQIGQPEQPVKAEKAEPVVESPMPTAEPEGNLTIEVADKEEKAEGKIVATDVDLTTPINPLEPFTRYKYPTLDLLKKYDDDEIPHVSKEEIMSNNAKIVEVLNSFNVKIKEIHATVGPTITLYEITPAEGQRISKIRNLEDDIALSLSALSTRIIAPIPGKGTIGIEVPNKQKNIVSMESILNSRKFKETTMTLPLALGKTITNEVFIVDLAKIPHMLVAGATGQGKSVGLNAIITSLLYKKHPNELKIILIDPKKVEFSVYSKITDHFMASIPDNLDEPIITDVTKVVKTLNSLCALMDHRYDLLKIAGVRNIKEYNNKFIHRELNPAKGHDFMPYIVVIIDEYGDLIMTAGKEIELPITRIAQLARAVGIHMVIATQRPTTNIITGSIKANFPGRIAFRVGSMIDSRTILDQPGANQLVGKGDMLYLNGGEPTRVQCAFVDTPEIVKVNDYICKQPGPVEPLLLPEPEVDGQVDSYGGGGDAGQKIDPLFEEAAREIVMSQQGSTSMIQRHFSIGYNRAGRLMDQLYNAGIVGPARGSKPRDVLVQDDTTLNNIINSLH